MSYDVPPGPASDNGWCMIYRPTLRVVSKACVGADCGLSLIACQSRGEYESSRCCEACSHE